VAGFEADVCEFVRDYGESELGGDLDPDLFAVVELKLEVGPWDRNIMVAVDSQTKVHALVAGVPECDVVERFDVEVGIEFAVEEMQGVSAELGGDAGGVVIGID